MYYSAPEDVCDDDDDDDEEELIVSPLHTLSDDSAATAIPATGAISAATVKAPEAVPQPSRFPQPQSSFVFCSLDSSWHVLRVLVIVADG